MRRARASGAPISDPCRSDSMSPMACAAICNFSMSRPTMYSSKVPRSIKMLTCACSEASYAAKRGRTSAKAVESLSKASAVCSVGVRTTRTKSKILASERIESLTTS